jgi:nucleoside-diphosphate-sugar epimerase
MAGAALITGAAGFLGAAVVQRLLERGEGWWVSTTSTPITTPPSNGPD